MIHYALTCDRGHEFESWFQSAAAFDRLKAADMVSCPECGSLQVAKALMAPRVQTARAAEERSTGPRSATLRPGVPQTEREKALAELRRQVEENSEYVGLAFAAEARAIHDGDAPERSIWGEARPDDARALIEDGIPVTPLPFRRERKSN